MTNFDHEKIQQLTDELNKIPVPKNALQQARVNAHHQNKQRRKHIRRTWQTVVTLAALFLLFVASVRVSPAFANAILKIPGLSPIVELIAHDKGLEDIVANDYYEEIFASETQNDVTFTLLGVIADETGMLLSYRITSPNDLQGLTLNRLEMEMTIDGKPMEVGFGYGWSAQYEPVYEIENTIQLSAVQLIDYSNKNFVLKAKMQKEQEMSFTIPFTLKKDIAQTKQFELNEKLVVDGQKIEVKSLDISPLRAAITIAIDPTNTMQILQFNELKLIDEKGEEWGKILNGTSGYENAREGEVTLFVQSNYFREPKKLTLHIPEIEALPKGEDFIKVDFSEQQVLYQPELLDFPITFRGLNQLSYSYPIMDGYSSSSFFWKAIDATRKDIYRNSFGNSESENMLTTHVQFIPHEGKLTNPVTIPVESFPNYLDGEVKLEIQLKE